MTQLQLIKSISVISTFSSTGEIVNNKGTIMLIKKIVLGTGAALVCVNFAYADTCSDFSYFPKTRPLAVLNCDFHHLYEERISQMITTFGRKGGHPIILNLGGELVLKYNDKTINANVTPAIFHELKSFEHAVLTVELILSQINLDRIKLELIQSDLEAAAPLIATLQLTDAYRDSTNQLVHRTLQLIEKMKNEATISRDTVVNEFKAIRPLVDNVAMIARKIEIKALDDALNPWLAQMTPNERKQIGIVVATAHQARDCEISIQYFSKKFGFQTGQGARHENGMVVLEGKFDETSALNLLARHYLDREIGAIMMNDPARLQRDILADPSTKLFGIS